jgi:hypothetical protein
VAAWATRLIEHKSALRSTSRFGFVGLPNALNLDQNLLRLSEVALDLASRRRWALLQYSWRMPLFHCAWLVVRMGVLFCKSGGGGGLLFCVRSYRCAWLSCARKRPVCIVVGGDPRGPFLRCAWPRRCTLKSSARGRAVVRVGMLFMCSVLEYCDIFPFLSLSLLLEHLLALCDIHKAPHHVAVLKNPPACDA